VIGDYSGASDGSFVEINKPGRDETTASFYPSYDDDGSGFVEIESDDY